MDYRELIREACAKVCEEHSAPPPPGGNDRRYKTSHALARLIRALDLDKIATKPEPVAYGNQENIVASRTLGTPIVAWLEAGSSVSNGRRVGFDAPLYTAPVAAPAVSQELAEARAEIERLAESVTACHREIYSRDSEIARLQKYAMLYQWIKENCRITGPDGYEFGAEEEVIASMKEKP